MADIDMDPRPEEPGVNAHGTPLNDAAVVQVVRNMMEDDTIWSADDVLATSPFTKLMSFITREGVIVQLYLREGRFVLARNNTMDTRGFSFLVLPDWAVDQPRWVVQGLVEYGLGTWGV
jgi:hypothetical protein